MPFALLLAGCGNDTAAPAAEGPGVETSPDAGPVVAFVDVTLVPMDNERTLGGQTVLVQDGLIVQVGPGESLWVPVGAERIAGEGRYLMPGLAEIHAHVPPGQDPSRELIEETLFLYVANGVTTIRGMLGAPYQIALGEELRHGELLGPRFYVGAPSVNGNTAPTPEAADSLVRDHAEVGYDFLKIHPGVPLDSWDQMVETANEVGLTFAGHVPADVGIYHAIRTGMSTIDHLDGYLEVTRRDDLGPDPTREELYRATDPDKLDELVRELAEHRIWQVPTQCLWNHLNGYVDPDSLLALEEFRYIPPSLRQNYRSRSNANRDNPAITPESDRAHREIRLMEDAGMTPYEVLLTGTRNVAVYVEEELGQEGNFGTIAPGNRADFILLEQNPLASLDALQERAGVMVQGRWLPNEEIRARLEEIAAQYR